jgi:hypothetical protein
VSLRAVCDALEDTSIRSTAGVWRLSRKGQTQVPRELGQCCGLMYSTAVDLLAVAGRLMLRRAAPRCNRATVYKLSSNNIGVLSSDSSQRLVKAHKRADDLST